MGQRESPYHTLNPFTLLRAALLEQQHPNKHIISRAAFLLMKILQQEPPPLTQQPVSAHSPGGLTVECVTSRRPRCLHVVCV